MLKYLYVLTHEFQVKFVLAKLIVVLTIILLVQNIHLYEKKEEI